MIRFEPLLTLSVTHEYYGGPCREVGYVVPRETAGVLAGARIITRERDGVLHLLYEADAAGQPLVRATGATLRVGLAPRDPGFANVTESGPGLDGTTALYRNAPDPAVLGPATGVTLVPVQAGLVLQQPDRPVTVEVQSPPGTALLATDVTAASGAAEASFDLGGLAPGGLTVVERYPGPVERSRAWYLHPEFRAAGGFGIVEVVVDAAFYGAPADLTIGFAARADTLKYYVVGAKYTDGDVNQLTVKDTGFADEGRPEVKFTKVQPGAFSASDLPAALLAGAEAKVVLFRSQAPVPRRDAGRRKLQLQKGNDVLIAHLPQPGADRASADQIIHLSKP